MPNREYEPCGIFAGVSGAKHCKVPQIEQRASQGFFIKSLCYTFDFALIMPVSVVRVHP